MDTGFRLVVENSIFFTLATVFLGLTSWAWHRAHPFYLPQPLPEWFKIWFGSVQFWGLVPPLVAFLWGIWHGMSTVWLVFAAYFVMLALQILSEIVMLRQFHSVVWVMVPYLYVPYRLWQLYEGFLLTSSPANLTWIRLLLLSEIVVWGVNYLLDLSQLPFLLRWPEMAKSEKEETANIPSA